jgi:hypothetical protein
MMHVLGENVGFEVGVGAADIRRRYVHARVRETPRDRFALDDELDVEAGEQDLRRAS